ncbi:MAG: response regulator [Methanomicrobiales archaeon]|nr:response regulator [Methanomicrobiales archaeon]
MSANKILIIEDEMVFAMELKETLQRLGYAVVGVARRGTEGIRIARETWPDLILMDIHLQGTMDGIETAETINTFYDIPVIFLTAYSDDATVNRAIKTQQYGFLTKPFNERALYSNIEMAIAKHRSLKKSRVDAKIIDSMIALVSDAVVTTDLAGRVTRINPAAEELFGHTRDEIVGNVLWETIEITSGSLSDLMHDVLAESIDATPLISWPDQIAIVTPHHGARSAFIKVGFIRESGKNGINELLFVFYPPERKKQES